MTLEIITVPCLRDNYAYLLRDAASGEVGLVDAPEASAIRRALDDRGWGLDLILITHHHGDHVEGVEELRGAYGARVVGAVADSRRLPPLDLEVAEGDTVALGESSAEVIDVSGHTIGHVAYYFRADDAVFTADSLMAMGCGRLFEGSAERMWESLSKLAKLPPATRVYSGHEYTEANARFAATVDAGNPRLAERIEAIAAARGRGEPTVPSILGEEIATNPFLRAVDPAMKAQLGLAGAPDAAVFAELRRRKDAF